MAAARDIFTHSKPSVRDEIARRIELLGTKKPAEVHGPDPHWLLGEFASLGEPVVRQFRPPLGLAKTRNPQLVMLLPGFGTHPARMRFMARELERAGHTVKRWGLGFNLGPTEENFTALARRIEHLHSSDGRKVVLVGWSLGGIFARELAKQQPQDVAKVITMGSPFSGNPYANNAWRIYQLVTGHSVEKPPVTCELAKKPPVETVALWSPRDGVVAPRSSCGRAGERDRAVALRCTHIGFSNSPEAIEAVASELERG